MGKINLRPKKELPKFSLLFKKKERRGWGGTLKKNERLGHSAV